MSTDKFRIGAVVIIAIIAAISTPFVSRLLINSRLSSIFENSGLNRVMIQLSTLIIVVFIGWLVIFFLLKNKKI